MADAQDAAKAWRRLAAPFLRRDNSSALQVAGGFFVSRLARARRAHKQSASVRDALRDADSWVAGGDKSGRAWTAHGVARAPVVLCREASERNAHRATKAAALIQQADAGRAPGKAPQAQAWPPRPPSQGSQGGGAFTDILFMNREDGKDKDQVVWAWDRVLREAGEERSTEFAERLCAWAAGAAAELKSYQADKGEDARVALPSALQDEASRGYVLAFSDARLDQNPHKMVTKKLLFGQIKLATEKMTFGEKVLVDSRMSGFHKPTLATFLEARAADAAPSWRDTPHETTSAEIVLRMLLRSERTQRLDALCRAADAGFSWDTVLARRRSGKNQKKGHSDMSAGDDDKARLAEGYALYLGGNALPQYLVGDTVAVKHKYGERLVVTKTYTVGAGASKEDRKAAAEREASKRNEFKEAACEGKILAWTDSMGWRGSKDTTSKDTTFEYLVEFRQKQSQVDETADIGGKQKGQKSKAKVRNVTELTETVVSRAVVLESALTPAKGTTWSSRAEYGDRLRAAVLLDDASAALEKVRAAFAIPGFQGVFARDALKWLKLSLYKGRPELVKEFLEVKLIEEDGAADERELRTNLVAAALRFAIREGEGSAAMQASEGLACAKLVLGTEGSKDCVRLGDLRLMLERLARAAAIGGRESQVALLKDMFVELLTAYPDGAALEAYALTGTKPLLFEVLDRDRNLPAKARNDLVLALAARLEELGRASVPAAARLAPHGLGSSHVAFARGDEALVKIMAGQAIPRDDYGRTPLILAVALPKPVPVIQAAVRGASAAHLEAVDSFGCSSLHYAARAGRVAIVKVLAAALPQHVLDAKNIAGESALSAAATSSSPQRVAVCAQLLARGATLDRDAAFQLLAFPEHSTRCPGWADVEPTLLQAPHDGLPIHALVAAGRVDAVRERLATAAPEALVRELHVVCHIDGGGGADLGATALHVAHDGEIARLLLGVDPNAWRRRSYHGDTPLHRACSRDVAEVTEALLAGGARWGRAFQNDEGLSPYEAATGRSKRIILAAIAEREKTRRRLEDEARRQRRLTDWVKTAETIDEAGKLTLIRDRVAVLVPPQTAENDAVEITRPSSPRPGSPRPEGTMFDPEVPVFLAPDALAQLFQIDGHSRRCAIDTIERVAVDGVPPGAVREGDKSLQLYTSADGSVVFERAFDYVDGARAHERVIRVFALDVRNAEVTTLLVERITKLHAAGRASPLAYTLLDEPGKGQKYYKLPDPISATGVCKFFRLTRTLIDIAASNTFLGVPHGVETDFELDHEETDQVCQWSRDPTPTLLLGRGGTGKTLIILQSLWKKYQLAAEEGEGGVVVFVTGSNVLRNSVREAFIGLRHAYHGIEPTDAPPASLLREDLGIDDGRPRVIFYTTNELLAAIDASCTRSLLSGDQRAESAATSLEESLRRHATAEVLAPEEATTEITDAHFTRWWQRGVLGRGVRADPGVVWSEILTHIKGSPRVSARGKPLSREEYLALPRKTAPAFAGLGSAAGEKWGSRDAVYDIYERYEAEKAKLVGAYDICDLVTSCMSQQLGGDYGGVKFSSLICDEVQDFTLSTVVLLLNLLEDEDHFMCGGDTAQTICKVTFNFKDLKVVLHRRRDKASKRLETHWAAAPADRGPIAPAVPRESQLRVLRTNYRCHQGVLSVANLCLEMMQLFPDSVDAIEPERAHFAGAAPLLFLDDDFSDVADVFSGGRTAVSEFGANQVIIVRNEAAKRALPAQLAGGLALTPWQAKGLEFADVIIYNFFTDSEAPDRAWGAGAREIGVELPDRAAAAFDTRQHLVLSNELKQLYVAVTRARERLVFFDQSPTAREAFFRSLLDRRVAQAHDGVFSPTDGAVALARASEAREWRARGNQLLERGEDGDYERASECFSKSGDEARRLLCIGLDTLSQARATDDRAKALTAAYLLARSECEGSEAPLAEALEACGEHGVATDAWRRLGRENEAFRASREHLRATDPEAHAAWKADADAAARAALAAKQAAVRRSQMAARKKARAPAEPVIGRPRAAPTETRSVARRLLDEKIENAATAPPRRADTSSEAAAPPSVASKVSRATSAATSAIAVAPSAHARERMVEREIAVRDLQEAKKYGARRAGRGGRIEFTYRGLVYVEAPGAAAVTAYYKTVPDGYCERAFVPYGGKKAARHEVDRLLQAMLRDRGAEIDISDHSERGSFGYLVASRTSEATDEAADGLRKLLSAGRASSPVKGLPTVSEDAPEAAAFPLLPVREESIGISSFPPLPTAPRPAAELAARLDAMEAAQRDSDARFAAVQDELRRAEAKLARSEQSRRATENKLRLSETARRAAETARDDMEVALATERSRADDNDALATTKKQLERATTSGRAMAARLRDNEQALAAATRRLNNALAAVAARDRTIQDRERTIQDRERELRELRDAQLLPEPVPADPVESFLEATGLGQFRETFAAEEIDLVTLRDLAVDDLQFLGLNDDECRRFLAARDANF